MRRVALGCAFAASLLMGLVSDARADTVVTEQFSGHLDQVTDTYGKLAAAGIAVGTPFSGYITYDASTAPTFNIAVGGPGNGMNAYYPALTAFHFTVQATTGPYEFGFNTIPAGAFVNDFTYSPGTSPDVFAAGVSGNGFTPEAAIPPQFPGDADQNWGVEFRLEDATGTVFTSDTPLPTSLNLANWSSHWVYFSSFYSGSGTSGSDYVVHGNIESMVQSAPAPAPAMTRGQRLAAALLLAFAGASLAGHRARERSARARLALD